MPDIGIQVETLRENVKIKHLQQRIVQLEQELHRSVNTNLRCYGLFNQMAPHGGDQLNSILSFQYGVPDCGYSGVHAQYWVQELFRQHEWQLITNAQNYGYHFAKWELMQLVEGKALQAEKEAEMHQKAQELWTNSEQRNQLIQNKNEYMENLNREQLNEPPQKQIENTENEFQLPKKPLKKRNLLNMNDALIKTPKSKKPSYATLLKKPEQQPEQQPEPKQPEQQPEPKQPEPKQPEPKQPEQPEQLEKQLEPKTPSKKSTKNKKNKKNKKNSNETVVVPDDLKPLTNDRLTLLLFEIPDDDHVNIARVKKEHERRENEQRKVSNELRQLSKDTSVMESFISLEKSSHQELLPTLKFKFNQEGKNYEVSTVRIHFPETSEIIYVEVPLASYEFKFEEVQVLNEEKQSVSTFGEEFIVKLKYSLQLIMQKTIHFIKKSEIPIVIRKIYELIIPNKQEDYPHYIQKCTQYMYGFGEMNLYYFWAQAIFCRLAFLKFNEYLQMIVQYTHLFKLEKKKNPHYKMREEWKYVWKLIDENYFFENEIYKNRLVTPSSEHQMVFNYNEKIFQEITQKIETYTTQFEKMQYRPTNLLDQLNSSILQCADGYFNQLKIYALSIHQMNIGISNIINFFPARDDFEYLKNHFPYLHLFGSVECREFSSKTSYLHTPEWAKELDTKLKLNVHTFYDQKTGVIIFQEQEQMTLRKFLEIKRNFIGEFS